MLRPIIGAIFACGILHINSAVADQSPPMRAEQLIDSAAIQTLREWIANPIMALSINAQNARHAKLTNDQIEQLDKQWRNEREAQDQPLIAATLSSPLSIYLLRIQALSNGAYNEIIAMDNRGLNVGQSATTSDYWQGDEAKFQKTYEVGPDAVFIDEPEFDEKTKCWNAQVNLTVTDPDTKRKIGAITVQVNLTELQRRATS